MKLLIVANNAEWASWPDKVREIREWYSPKVLLDIDIKHTKFPSIPFVDYGNTALPGSSGVHYLWYDQNVASLATGYDLVLFVVPTAQWGLTNSARGWRTDRNTGPVEMQIGCDENEYNYFPDGTKIGTFYSYARHELMHALFMVTGQEDTTHKWFDWEKKPEKARDELIFKMPPPMDPPIVPLPQDKLKDFCLAIQYMEGYFAPGENPRYPTGSRSWKNKNPGNIKFIGQDLAIGKDKSGFAVFKSYEDGFYTLKEFIRRCALGYSTVYKPGMNFKQFFGIYAPSADNNNPDHYAAVVAARTGLSIDTTIKQLLPGAKFQYVYEVNLKYGNLPGPEVRKLQEGMQAIRRPDGMFYMTPGVFGAFGPKTKTALGQFQTDHGIIDPGGQGTNFGPQSRAALNEEIRKLNQ